LVFRGLAYDDIDGFRDLSEFLCQLDEIEFTEGKRLYGLLSLVEVLLRDRKSERFILDRDEASDKVKVDVIGVPWGVCLRQEGFKVCEVLQMIIVLVGLNVRPALLEAKLVLQRLVQPDSLLFIYNLIISSLLRFFRPVIIYLDLIKHLPLDLSSFLRW
jgi:hypothetical protein